MSRVFVRQTEKTARVIRGGASAFFFTRFKRSATARDDVEFSLRNGEKKDNESRNGISNSSEDASVYFSTLDRLLINACLRKSVKE